MNALQVMLGLNSKIHAELLYLRNAMLARETTVTGEIYTNSAQGDHLSLEQYEGRVNCELIRNCKLYLGYGLVSRFEFELRHCLQGSEKHSSTLALRAHESGTNITAHEFVSKLSDVLEIDEHYFERLMAHGLALEKLCKNPSATAESIKFNNFSFSHLASVEDGYFFKNTSDVLSIVILINNICGKSFSDSEIKSACISIDYLDAFSSRDAVCEVAGIKLTAQKNGSIKFTLDKAKAEILKTKVEPYLDNFQRLLVDISKVKSAEAC